MRRNHPFEPQFGLGPLNRVSIECHLREVKGAIVKRHLVWVLLCQFLTLPSLLPAQSGPSKEDAALQHAHQILQSTPLIDGHNDLPWTIRTNSHSPRDVEAYDLSKRTPCDTDLARLKEGQVGAQFWSVWVPGELKEQGYTKLQLEQIDIARRMIARYPGNLTLALTASDIESALKKGLIASLLGMEGGHVIENSLGALRAYYALGVRYMTLTHNVTLDWADAALDEPKHAGRSGRYFKIPLPICRISQERLERCGPQKIGR